MMGLVLMHVQLLLPATMLLEFHFVHCFMNALIESDHMLKELLEF